MIYAFYVLNLNLLFHMMRVKINNFNLSSMFFVRTYFTPSFWAYFVSPIDEGPIY